MLKRILVVLDGSNAASCAKKYALKLAKELKTELTGVGVIDTPWITAAQPEPLGGAAFKIHRDQELIKKTHDRIEEMLTKFRNECDKNDVKCYVSELEGFPATEIEGLSEEHDLIIIGKTTDFHGDLDGDTDLTVKHILRDNPRPVIVIPRDLDLTGKIVVAYDGSMQAARALHMFLLLGLGIGHKIHVVSVARRKSEADTMAQRALEMCKLHDMDVEAEGMESRKAPELVILNRAKELKANMVVMGAYGTQGLREYIFGTTTEHLMKQSDVALFIHH
jgi:nucleotide-binding universal stress UspA family protein